MLVWVGHSCPTLLTLGLLLVLRRTSTDKGVNPKLKTKVKSVGQECPTHTAYLTSLLSARPTATCSLPAS
jgi:hypothetical protein